MHTILHALACPPENAYALTSPWFLLSFEFDAIFPLRSIKTLGNLVQNENYLTIYFWLERVVRQDWSYRWMSFWLLFLLGCCFFWISILIISLRKYIKKLFQNENCNFAKWMTFWLLLFRSPRLFLPGNVFWNLLLLIFSLILSLSLDYLNSTHYFPLRVLTFFAILFRM